MAPGPVRNSVDIDDSEILYRRVAGEQVKREQGVAVRAGKNAFLDSPDGTDCSILLASKLAEHGLSLESILVSNSRRYGLVAFTAGDARACGFGVLYTPKFPHEPAHGSLTGDKTDPQLRKDLAKKTQVLFEPPRR